MSPPAIFLTTDFGFADHYVGTVKGVILSINPQATILDLTHQVQPYNIRQASFILGASHRFSPSASIHVAVVDPGVGTHRRAVLLITPRAQFLAPDNGVLSGVIASVSPSSDSPISPCSKEGQGGFAGQQSIAIPPNCSAYQLTNPDYWLHPVSDTFHGRDIFAPVAAHLSLGIPPHSLGEAVKDLFYLPTPRPGWQGNRVLGEVIYGDHFGNLITNIPVEALQALDPTSLQVSIKGRRISGFEADLPQQPHYGPSSAASGPFRHPAGGSHRQPRLPGNCRARWQCRYGTGSLHRRAGFSCNSPLICFPRPLTSANGYLDTPKLRGGPRYRMSTSSWL